MPIFQYVKKISRGSVSTSNRPKRIVAVDWDDRTLRVVHALLAKRSVKIDRMLSVKVPAGVDPANPEQMGSHIRRTLSQEGISTRQAVVDIPRDQVILKTLTLPVGKPEDLPGMVEIQIAKELPFPAAEAVIDFAQAPPDPQSATGEVLVAAIRREVLEQYEATLAAAELRLDRIGLRPYANKVTVCELLKHALPERVLFIDVRPTFMEIDVLRDGVLAFSRSASVAVPQGVAEPRPLSIRRPPVTESRDGEGGDAEGAPEPSTLDAVLHSLLLEVTRSIEAYRVNDPGAMIDHVVIGGDVGVEEALAEAIQRRLDLNVELYNPAATFGWDPDEGAGASAFAASLGLVLGYSEDGALHFDFLHPKKTVSVTQERLRKAPMVAAVAALFLAAAGVALGYYTKKPREKLAWLEEKIETLRSRRSANKEFLSTIEEVRAFDEGQLVWVDELYDVISLLPENDELLVRHVDMQQEDGDERGSMTLKTETKRRETATEVIRRLQEFRRPGRELPRFKVTMGPQTEKKQEKYPYSQELRIEILDDQPRRRSDSREAFTD